ncbi:hypothetical protein Pcac1_g24917 [Phytophthora cactorum]|nr:hypothetical protein Pcac1_g24917 [Phytophthora cactorum]
MGTRIPGKKRFHGGKRLCKEERCPSKDHGNGFCVSSVSFVKSSVSGVPSVAEWHVQAGVSSDCVRVLVFSTTATLTNPCLWDQDYGNSKEIKMAEHLGAAIRERYACKAFLPESIPDETLQEILKLTQRSPSGFNTQSWVCIVLRTTEDRAALANAMIDANVRKVNEAPVVVVLAADCEPSKNVPRMQQLNRDNGAPDDFVNRIPALVEMFSGEHDPKVSTEAWAYKQATFAAATFLYAAQVHGLATCPMEGFDQAGVKKVLNIPDRYSIPVVVALGHANPAAKPAKPSVRFPPTEVFFDGKFGQSTEELFAEK